MTTTISPSVGHGVIFTQQGVGTSPGYDAVDFRRADSNGLQEGVYNSGDFMVTQRGAGANMSVDIAAGSGATALVQGDTITGQGLYTVAPHSGTINETITAADPTNPRIDQIVLEVLDNVHDASGNNVARTRVVTGTPTSGATLDNRSGAAALPGSALLLADVRVPAAAASIANSNIRDRRKWARGAFCLISRTSNAAAGNNYTTTSGVFGLIDSTNIQPRIECSGVPLRLKVIGLFGVATQPTTYDLGFMSDGTAISSADAQEVTNNSAGTQIRSYEFDYGPSAGSHLLGPCWKVSGSITLTAIAQSGFALQFLVEELVRQNTANNTTTTG